MTTTQENSNTEATAPNDTEDTQTKAKSKAYQRQNIAQRLVINKRALDNIRSSPEIAGQLAVFGYTPEKINSFEKLYNEAVEANSHQQKEFGEKAEAYAEFERLFSVSKKLLGCGQHCKNRIQETTGKINQTRSRPSQKANHQRTHRPNPNFL